MSHDAAYPMRRKAQPKHVIARERGKKREGRREERKKEHTQIKRADNHSFTATLTPEKSRAEEERDQVMRPDFARQHPHNLENRSVNGK